MLVVLERIMEINFNILKSIFPSHDIIEHCGDGGSSYIRSWNICCWGDNPGSIYLYEINIKNVIGESYISEIIDEFINVSEGVVYKIVNSKRWGIKPLTLVNINSLSSLSKILTDSIHADSIYSVIGVTEYCDLILDIKDEYGLGISSIIYDLKTNSIWDVVNMSLYQRQLESTRPLFNTNSSSIDVVLIRNSKDLFMKYSINLTSSHKLKDNVINVDDFIIKMVPGLELYRYRILSRDTFTVNSTEEVREFIKNIYAYYDLLLPFL